MAARRVLGRLGLLILSLLLIAGLGARTAGALPCPHAVAAVPESATALTMESGWGKPVGERKSEAILACCAPSCCLAHGAAVVPPLAECGPAPGRVLPRPVASRLGQSRAGDGPWRPPPPHLAR